MNRRQFIKGTAFLLNASLIGSLPRSRPAESYPVTLLPMASYGIDLSREIASAISEDGLVVKGKRVILKPNFVEVHPGRPINTHIQVIANVAEACLKLGASVVIVGEASGHRRDPWFSVLNPDLRTVLDKRVKCVDLNHGDAVRVANRGKRTGLSSFYIAEPVMRGDVLISLPKLKTHHWMGVTLSLKNLFGVLPGIYYGWPKNLLHFRGIDNSILDLAETIKVHYTVIDGVVGMEGDGPIMGRAKRVGALIMSPFSLAADATAARLMGFDPERIPYLAMAGRFLPGMDGSHISFRGENPKRFAMRFDCLDEFKSMQGGPFW